MYCNNLLNYINTQNDEEYNELLTPVANATAVSPICWIVPNFVRFNNCIKHNVSCTVLTLGCAIMTYLYDTFVNPLNIHRSSDGLQEIGNEERQLVSALSTIQSLGTHKLLTTYASAGELINLHLNPGGYR